MAIASTDILYKLSTAGGSAGNTTSGVAATSLGKYVSTTQLSSTALGNLFDNVSGAENAASAVDYRCIFIHNAHATLTLSSPTIYLSGGDPAGGTNIAIAVDTTAASAVGSSTAQSLIGASETAPGSSVTALAYSAPSTSSGGLSLGDLTAGQVKAVWIRRTAANSAPVSAETITLAVSGNTPA